MSDLILPGNLLVAQPFLGDSNFERSVILIAEHNAEGTIGFVVNQPTDFKFSSINSTDLDQLLPIKKGGPVDNESLHFIHRVPNLIANGKEIAKGVFWGGEMKDVENALSKSHLSAKDIQFFLGYTGWAPRQLELEIKQKSWFLSSKPVNCIFSIKEEEIWKDILLQTGGSYKLWAQAPENPLLN